MGNRKLLFGLLMDTCWYVLQKFSNDEKHLGATPAVISILHTWGQQMSFHPHVHCIVSGGGIDANGKWKEAKKNHWRFLFSETAMQQVYKARFIHELQRLKSIGSLQYDQGDERWQLLIQSILKPDWVINSRAPFGGPAQVVEYLGRYTHKVAISNHRIESVDEVNKTVSFVYKDYSDGSKQKQMTLSCSEFIRRFEQHILPKGFTKIRHYGLLCNRNRKERVQAIHQQLKLPPPMPEVTLDYASRMLITHGIDVHVCKCCGIGRLTLVKVVHGKLAREP